MTFWKNGKKECEKHERFARQDLLSSQRGFTPGAKVHLWASRLLLVFTWENHPTSLVGGCSRGWKMNCQTPKHPSHNPVRGMVRSLDGQLNLYVKGQVEKLRLSMMTFLSRPHIFSTLCGRLFQNCFSYFDCFFMFQWWTFNMGKSH